MVSSTSGPPGRPVDECLRVVGSCQVYLGLFAMRYSSIPDGYDRSMTHLEYDEAQRLELPSLIYIIDEENQPILPKHVETGPGAEKLRELKERLEETPCRQLLYYTRGPSCPHPP